MDLQASDVDGVTKVALVGRLDSAGAGAIEMRFTATVVPRGNPVIVDLGGVTFLASLGLRLLISTARALARKEATMVLFGANGAVTEVLETSAVADIIPVVATEAEALALARG